MNTKRLFSSLVGLTLTAYPASAEINGTSGDILQAPPPPSVAEGDSEHDTFMRAFDEQQEVVRQRMRHVRVERRFRPAG